MRYIHGLAVGFLGFGLLAVHPLLTEGGGANLDSIQQFLAVPSALARVTDANWPSTQKLPDLFLIQDVHRHPQVQSLVASLVVHGYNSWGVKKVFLEGAFTPLDMTLFHRIPNKTRVLLMQRLINDGNLSGPELAAIEIMEREWRDPPVSPFQLFGMEDPKLYRRNVQAYQTVLSLRDRALQDLVSIRRLQDSMQNPEQNPLNKQLDRVDAMLHLKLTSTDYEAYLKAKDAVPSTPALTPAIQAAEEFYRVVQERSRFFLKEVARRVPASNAPRIIVVGGFHTSAMARLLRQEGRSFVVLTPAVYFTEADPLYEKRMKETSRILAQALPAARN